MKLYVFRYVHANDLQIICENGPTENLLLIQRPMQLSLKVGLRSVHSTQALPLVKKRSDSQAVEHTPPPSGWEQGVVAELC